MVRLEFSVLCEQYRASLKSNPVAGSFEVIFIPVFGHVNQYLTVVLSLREAFVEKCE
jgi:hypothetical protein